MPKMEKIEIEIPKSLLKEIQRFTDDVPSYLIWSALGELDRNYEEMKQQLKNMKKR